MTSQKANAVAISILGKEYLINCPEGQEYSLQQSAQHVDEKMREIRDSGKIIGSDRIAVMAALNIAHELVMLQGKATDIDDESLDRLQQVQQRISRKLSEFESR